MSAVDPTKRFRTGFPCPVCGGTKDDVPGTGTRCWGFLSEDGNWAHCTRAEHAGPLKAGDDGDYAHRLTGSCKCGTPHGAAIPTPTAASPATPKPKPVKTMRHEIKDEAGTVLAIHGRTYYKDGTKTLWWEQPDGTKGLNGTKPADLPLYDIHELAADKDAVVVLEGETTRDALKAAGIPALGTVTGSGVTPADEVLKALLDFKMVALWPDNDPGGHEHMKRISERLAHLGHPCVVILSWPEAGDGEDAADFFKKGGTAEKVKEMMAEAIAPPIALEIPPIDITGPSVSGGDPTVLAVLAEAGHVRRLHPAQDVQDGILWYGSQIDGEHLIIINSERHTYQPESMPLGLKLRHTWPGLSSVIDHEFIAGWLNGDSAKVSEVLDAAEEYYGSHMVLPNPEADALWLAAWTVGTYCYRAFPVYPYIGVGSPTKRCGKSRLVDLIQRVGFNAADRGTLPTPAVLYRLAEITSGVQFFDEAEGLTGADKEKSEAVMAILCAGFERGQTVLRMEKGEKQEKFKVSSHEVYAPRVIAGIRALKDTLEDRSIKLTLARRKPTEAFDNTMPSRADMAPLRAACALACLTSIKDIAAEYGSARALLLGAKLDDRAADLWAPLVAIVAVADDQDNGDRLSRLLVAAGAHREIREGAEEDSGPIVARLKVLAELCHGQPWEGAPALLLDAVSLKPGFDYVKSTKALASVLNPLGFFNRQVRRGGSLTRVYEISPAALKDLFERYGALAANDAVTASEGVTA